MATKYHVHGNDHAGGPLDRTSPIASTASTSYLTAPLPLNSDNLFGVRAYDDATGSEELNSDAVVRIVVDGSGNDVTNRPAPPQGLTARPTKAGGVRLTWAYPRKPAGGVPTLFDVFLNAGSVVNWAASPVHTEGYAGGFYSVDIPGLSDGVTYAVGVRARNASGSSANTDSLTFAADATAPSPVDSLSDTLV